MPESVYTLKLLIFNCKGVDYTFHYISLKNCNDNSIITIGLLDGDSQILVEEK